jgi:hypothetical protein
MLMNEINESREEIIIDEDDQIEYSVPKQNKGRNGAGSML